MSAPPWGFWGHKRINRIAVFTLPQEMFGFYKHHIEYITASAVNPDKRRYATKGEAPRHYIDIDHYGEQPFDSMPRKWFDAVEKYSEDTLLAYGIVPWHVDRMMLWLTEAFEKKDGPLILRLSAEIGHYIADAHVPLHTTENYNGQLTNQVGIHGFWESRLPELFGEDYDYFVGKASYVENSLDMIWDIVMDSHHMLDSVLTIEKELSQTFDSDQIYSFEKRGATTTRVYSESYSRAYSNHLSGMVERRMRASIIDIGSLWMTAWVNAGQPNLQDLLDDELMKQMEEELQKVQEDTLYNHHEIKGREHPNTGLD